MWRPVLDRLWSILYIPGVSARTLAETSPGGRLRDLRLARGWTQPKLAQRAKVSIHTISAAERDERIPQELTQERLAKALATPTSPIHRRDIWPNGANP